MFIKNYRVYTSDTQLIEYVSSKGKPVIISTGIATLEEIEEAVNICRSVGNNQIILLKCTSEYPAKLEDANLKTLVDLKNRFDVLVGLSDHTIDIEVPLTAVALGAKVIEKHFILDKEIGGPDASFSLEPDQFKYMVDSIRKVEKAIGKVDYEMTEKKCKSREFSRSLFIVMDLKKGDTLSEDNVKSIRPGFGMSPKNYKYILGKKVNQDIKRGTPLRKEHID